MNYQQQMPMGMPMPNQMSKPPLNNPMPPQMPRPPLNNPMPQTPPQMPQMGMPPQMPPQMTQPQMSPEGYPMQGIAEHLANQGRYGDSMLMHVNPAEVDGIASLMPGGRLPINPQTGQPEAFIGMILGMLAKPLLAKGVAALGMKAGAGALGTALTGLAGSSAAMSGLTTGLIETARTGDIKKGFASGLMGAGVGKALGAATGAVDEGVKTATSNLDKLTNVDTGELAGVSKGITDLQGIGRIGNLTADQNLALKGLEAEKELLVGGARIDMPLGGTGTDLGSISRAEDALRNARVAANTSYGSMGDVFDPKGFKAGAGALMSPEAMLPLAVGSGYGAQIDAQDQREAYAKEREGERVAEFERGEDLVAEGLTEVGRDYGVNMMDNPYDIYAKNQGGIISIDPSQYQQTLQGLSDVAGPVEMAGGSSLPQSVEVSPSSYLGMPPSVGGKGGGEGSNRYPGLGVGGAARRQGLIRGSELVTPDEGYRPGFDAEHKFFKQKEVVVDPAVQTANQGSNQAYTAPINEGLSSFYSDKMGGGSNLGMNSFGLEMAGIDPREFMDTQRRANSDQGGRQKAKAMRDVREMEEKRDKAVDLYSDNAQEIDQASYESVMKNPYLSEFDPRQFMGRVGGGMAEGGIAEIPPQAAEQEMMPQNNPNAMQAEYTQLIEQTAMAVLGQISGEEAEIIINRFIDEFGQEAFQVLRDQVLQNVVPDAQTEGLLSGEGGGMDDEIQGMIGDQQRVAVSPGEFIVPADVVSGLGDGDTGAGANELDGMMERVRVERTGTSKQPQRLASSGGLLPA